MESIVLILTNVLQIILVIHKQNAKIYQAVFAVLAATVGKVTEFILASIRLKQCVNKKPTSVLVETTHLVSLQKSKMKLQLSASVTKGIVTIHRLDNAMVKF